MKVCLAVGTMYYPEGGGWQWVPLNWTLGLRAAGCDVVWIEGVTMSAPVEESLANLELLGRRLEPFGLADRLGLFPWDEPIPPELQEHARALEDVADADLLVNLSYGTPQSVIDRFRRSALVDIDPGLLQVWAAAGQMSIRRHDVYFTTGETVGRPHARFPDAGFGWDHTAPCVALEWWNPEPVPQDAAFTTVSSWGTYDEWMEEDGRWYSNDKRDGFLPFLDLPSRTEQPLELALCLSDDQEEERESLQRRGWRVRDALAVAATPWDYQAYIAGSLGEFSCVKPSCRRLENAWVSDRTVCYLASGKPAVIEDTGPSALLRDGGGVFRFRDIHEAERALAAVAEDYDRQSKLARALAEELFDAKTIATCALERALD
jgi:hypothetical protein